MEGVTLGGAEFYRFQKRYGRVSQSQRGTVIYRFPDRVTTAAGQDERPPSLRPAWMDRSGIRPWAEGATVPRHDSASASRRTRGGTHRGCRAGRGIQLRRHRGSRGGVQRRRCQPCRPAARCLASLLRLTRRLAAAETAVTGPAADVRPLHGGATSPPEEPPLCRDTAEMVLGADCADCRLILATSPNSSTHEEHRCLLRPRRLTIRQTRQVEIRAAAESTCALKIGHLNVRSLTAHLDQVNLLLLREQLDVLCLSETWLTEIIDTSALLLPGYTICRRDRKTKKIGGGVAILYRNNLKAGQLRVPADDTAVEALWMQISSRSTIIVGAVYRPPSGPTAPAIDCLHSQLAHVLVRARPTYLLGDVNIDVSQTAKPGVASYTQHLSDLSLRQLITEPTRPGPTPSLIDHLVTNRPDLTTGVRVTPCNISDHDLITALVADVKTRPTSS